jgi:hypothetical protein
MKPKQIFAVPLIAALAAAALLSACAGAPAPSAGTGGSTREEGIA